MIRRSTILRISALLGAVLLLCAFDSTWKAFKNKKANFEVMMPGTPKESTSFEQTAAGKIGLYQAIVVVEPKAYFVAYSDMPKSTWKGDPKTMLEGARDGAAQRIQGKVVADRELKLAGKYLGREFKIVKDQMELTQRVYLVKHRLYQVNMGCMAGKCSNEEIQAYLDSFKLLGKPK